MQYIETAYIVQYWHANPTWWLAENELFDLRGAALQYETAMKYEVNAVPMALVMQNSARQASQGSVTLEKTRVINMMHHGDGFYSLVVFAWYKNVPRSYTIHFALRNSGNQTPIKSQAYPDPATGLDSGSKRESLYLYPYPQPVVYPRDPKTNRTPGFDSFSDYMRARLRAWISPLVHL